MNNLTIVIPNGQSDLSTVACIVGTYEIFLEANEYWKKQGRNTKFTIELAGVSEDEVISNGLLTLRPHTNISKIPHSHLVVIPASLIRNYQTATKGNKLLIDWIAKQYKQGAEIASMCTGVFTLAASGVLEGKACSTHWAVSENFMLNFPNVGLQTEKLITDENGIYTNGGAYSFLNLIIYLVEKHYDRQTAIYCSKVFQIDINRQSQSEFIMFSNQKLHDDEQVKKAQLYIENHIDEKISIEDLCEKLSVARRNFDRRFIKATGNSPLEYIQRVKIESAKKNLENTRKTISEVMYDTGYSDVKAFREVFKKITGLSPTKYKAKYNKEE